MQYFITLISIHAYLCNIAFFGIFIDITRINKSQKCYWRHELVFWEKRDPQILILIIDHTCLVNLICKKHTVAKYKYGWHSKIRCTSGGGSSVRKYTKNEAETQFSHAYSILSYRIQNPDHPNMHTLFCSLVILSAKGRRRRDDIHIKHWICHWS